MYPLSQHMQPLEKGTHGRRRRRKKICSASSSSDDTWDATCITIVIISCTLLSLDLFNSPCIYDVASLSPLLSAGLCCEAKLASTESCITLSPVQDSIKDNQMRSSQLAPCLDNVLREHFQKGRTKYKHGETTTHVLLLFCYIHCVLLTKASNPREREGRGGQQKARIHNSWLLLVAIVQ